MEYIKGETITFKKIICNNCNFENSDCNIKIFNVSNLDKLTKIDEFEASKKDGYFYAQIQTKNYNITKTLCAIITINDNSNISKKKMYFKEI